MIGTLCWFSVVSCSLCGCAIGSIDYICLGTWQLLMHCSFCVVSVCVGLCLGFGCCLLYVGFEVAVCVVMYGYCL